MLFLQSNGQKHNLVTEFSTCFVENGNIMCCHISWSLSVKHGTNYEVFLFWSLKHKTNSQILINVRPGENRLTGKIVHPESILIRTIECQILNCVSVKHWKYGCAPYTSVFGSGVETSFFEKILFFFGNDEKNNVLSRLWLLLSGMGTRSIVARISVLLSAVWKLDDVCQGTGFGPWTWKTYVLVVGQP